MKRLLAFLILCVTTCVLAGGLTVKRFPIQSCIPDSGTQRIYWLGPFDAADVVYSGDSLKDIDFSIYGGDTMRIAWNVDLWARTRPSATGALNSAMTVEDSVVLCWSRSAISPWDTLYGIRGNIFVTDSTATAGRTKITSSTTTSPTIAQLYGIKSVTKTLPDLPTYLFIKVYVPFLADCTGVTNRDSLAFRSNTVYGSVRFFKL